MVQMRSRYGSHEIPYASHEIPAWFSCDPGTVLMILKLTKTRDPAIMETMEKSRKCEILHQSIPGEGLKYRDKCVKKEIVLNEWHCSYLTGNIKICCSFHFVLLWFCCYS